MGMPNTGQVIGITISSISVGSSSKGDVSGFCAIFELVLECFNIFLG